MALAGSASAHDTWFMPLPPGADGVPLLALGTGNRFPRQETALDMDKVERAVCQGTDSRAVPLQWLAYRDDATLLQPAQRVEPGQRLRCWMQAQPLPITLDDRLVQVYLDEIRALPAVRAHWAALQARGVRWQETYTKHARIEGAGPGQPGLPATGTTAGPGTPGLDLQPDMPADALHAGDRLRVRLLRDGQPLAGQPVALHNDRSPLVLWQASDAEGWLTLVLPLAARWLVTSVDLRPSPGQADAWESRFASLAIETLPRR